MIYGRVTFPSKFMIAARSIREAEKKKKSAKTAAIKFGRNPVTTWLR